MITISPFSGKYLFFLKDLWYEFIKEEVSPEELFFYSFKNFTLKYLEMKLWKNLFNISGFWDFFWIIEKEKKPIGMLEVFPHPLDSSKWFLRNFAIKNSFRNFGFGTETLKILFKFILEQGGSEIFLEVREENPARRLYNRIGFTELDEKCFFYIPAGALFDNTGEEVEFLSTYRAKDKFNQISIQWFKQMGGIALSMLEYIPSATKTGFMLSEVILFLQRQKLIIALNKDTLDKTAIVYWLKRDKKFSIELKALLPLDKEAIIRFLKGVLGKLAGYDILFSSAGISQYKLEIAKRIGAKLYRTNIIMGKRLEE